MTLAEQVLNFVADFPRLGHTLLRFEDGVEWSVIGTPDQKVLILHIPKKEPLFQSFSPKLKLSIDRDGKITDIEPSVQKSHHKYLIPLLTHSSVTGFSRKYNGSFKVSELPDAKNFIKNNPKYGR